MSAWRAGCIATCLASLLFAMCRAEPDFGKLMGSSAVDGQDASPCSGMSMPECFSVAFGKLQTLESKGATLQADFMRMAEESKLKDAKISEMELRISSLEASLSEAVAARDAREKESRLWEEKDIVQQGSAFEFKEVRAWHATSNPCTGMLVPDCFDKVWNYIFHVEKERNQTESDFERVAEDTHTGLLQLYGLVDGHTKDIAQNRQDITSNRASIHSSQSSIAQLMSAGYIVAGGYQQWGADDLACLVKNPITNSCTCSSGFSPEPLLRSTVSGLKKDADWTVLCMKRVSAAVASAEALMI